MLDVISDTPAVKVYEFHPYAKLFPLLKGKEFDDLVADIQKHGLHEPIVLHDDRILDGRNRYRACLRAGVKPVFETFEGSLAEATAFVISANVYRRHLTPEGKRKAIEAAIKANPEKSDRLIAKEAKTDHKIVGRTRRRMESTGAAPQLKKRTGADGKERKSPSAAIKRTGVNAFTPKALLDRESVTTAPLTEPQTIATREDTGPMSTGEIDRLRVRNDELEQENRRLTHINAAQADEIDFFKGLTPKPPTLAESLIAVIERLAPNSEFVAGLRDGEKLAVSQVVMGLRAVLKEACKKKPARAAVDDDIPAFLDRTTRR